MKRKALFVALLTLICLFFLLGAFIRTEGDYMRYFFWQDDADTGMDFFNSLAETVGGEPYGRFFTVYPPFSNGIFYAMQAMVPSEVKDCWPRCHEDMVALRRTPGDLRTYQSTAVLFLFNFAVYIFMTEAIIVYKFRQDAVSGIGLAFTAIFSYGSLTALERGNIIAIAMVFTMIFIFGYDSPRRIVRILSCCSLVIAAAIKLYPAVFFLLMFDGKKSRSSRVFYTLSCIELGLIICLIPLFWFGGLSDLGLFLKILIGFNTVGNDDAVYYRYGMRGIAEHITMSPRLHSLLLASDPVQLYRFLLVFSSIVLLYAFFRHMRSEEDPCEAAFDLTIILILVQTRSCDYTLCFFVPVLILMLFGENTLCLQRIPYFIMLLIFTLPYPTTAINDASNMVLHHVDIVQFTLITAVMYEFAVYIGLPLLHILHYMIHSNFSPPHRFA